MRRHTTTQLIAKEGWNQSIVLLMLTLCAYALSFLTWFFVVLLGATLWMYRNPERLMEEEDEHALIAPIDGKITAISKVNANDGREWLRVVIQKRLYDVGIARAPMAMRIHTVEKRYGLPLSYTSPLAKALREKIVLTCKDKGHEIKIVFYAGLFSQKIEIFEKVSGLKAGERLAFFTQGEVALLLPLDTRIKVVLNDEVKAGESVLGYFAYKANDE